MVGVLDIQGSVEEHVACLKRLGISAVLVKKAEHLKGLNGLIIPGGESTTIGKLLVRFGLRDAIVQCAADGMAIWGTCAGAILLAKEVLGGDVDGLKLMDVVVERNAYGSQLDSFECEVDFDGVGKIPAVFIRAPKIVSVGDDVEVLARIGEEIVAAREGGFLISTFHPELTDSLKVHEWFLGACHL